MLDLSKLAQEYYNIKLTDKTILKIRKPSQAILKTMIEFQNADRIEEAEVIDFLYDLIFRIFNRNTEDRRFTREEIEEMMSVEIAVEVLKDYFTFSLKILGE